jgi:hypothetical protein
MGTRVGRQHPTMRISDREVFSGFTSDVLGLPIHVSAVHQV